MLQALEANLMAEQRAVSEQECALGTAVHMVLAVGHERGPEQRWASACRYFVFKQALTPLQVRCCAARVPHHTCSAKRQV